VGLHVLDLTRVGSLREVAPGGRLLAPGAVDDHALGEERQHHDDDDWERCALEKPAHGLPRLPAWGTWLNDITAVFRLFDVNQGFPPPGTRPRHRGFQPHDAVVSAARRGDLKALRSGLRAAASRPARRRTGGCGSARR